MEKGPGHRETRHCRPLAPQGLPPLLAVYLDTRTWATANLKGDEELDRAIGDREWLARTQNPR